ncbi:MAG TPA: DUF2125 domain-containing protein [Rhodospirillales bacterium]
MVDSPRQPDDPAAAAGAPTAGLSPPVGRNFGLIALAAAGAVVLAAVLYNFYWEFSARQLRTGIEQWLAVRTQEGTRITYSAIAVDGYPFRLVATIAQPSAARFTGVTPWSWRGPALTVAARPWRPSRLRLTAPGRHWLTTVVGGRAREYDVAVETLRLKLQVGRHGVERATLVARGLAAKEEGAGEALRLKAADVAFKRATKAEAGKPGLELTVAAAGAVFAVEPAPGLGRVTERFGLVAAVANTVPPALTGADLAKWRDHGGIVDVRQLSVRHGPLIADGDGTLALDAEMQPMAAFTIRVRGYDEVIDRLTATGAIKPQPAALAKAALGLLAGQQGAGGEIKVPLSIQDRRLYLGPVPVARLPAVVWD